MADTRVITVTGYLSEDMRTIELEHEGVMARLFQPWVGKRLNLDVSIFRRRRSDRQNRYVHGPVVNRVRIFEYERTGILLSHDATYAFLRNICGHKMHIDVIDGRDIITMTGKRFSQMTTVEFEEAMTTVRDYFEERGCHIEEPQGESLWTDYQPSAK